MLLLFFQGPILRTFMGVCSYYNSFLPTLSQIVEPIFMKCAHFKCSDVQKALEVLKESLATGPMLVYPDLNKPYVLYTVASDMPSTEIKWR